MDCAGQERKHVPWERSLVHTMAVPIRKSVVPSLVLAADCVAEVVLPVLPFSSHPTWTCFTSLPSHAFPIHPFPQHPFYPPHSIPSTFPSPTSFLPLPSLSPPPPPTVGDQTVSPCCAPFAVSRGAILLANLAPEQTRWNTPCKQGILLCDFC